MSQQPTLEQRKHRAERYLPLFDKLVDEIENEWLDIERHHTVTLDGVVRSVWKTGPAQCPMVMTLERAQSSYAHEAYDIYTLHLQVMDVTLTFTDAGPVTLRDSAMEDFAPIPSYNVLTRAWKKTLYEVWGFLDGFARCDIYAQYMRQGKSFPYAYTHTSPRRKPFFSPRSLSAHNHPLRYGEWTLTPIESRYNGYKIGGISLVSSPQLFRGAPGLRIDMDDLFPVNAIEVRYTFLPEGGWEPITTTFSLLPRGIHQGQPFVSLAKDYKQVSEVLSVLECVRALICDICCDMPTVRENIVSNLSTMESDLKEAL